MSAHPNRGRDAPGRNPDPAEIRAAREAAGLTQTTAAEIIWGTLRAWQDYEAGARRMHPAIWWAWRERVRRRAKSRQERA